MTEHSIKQFAFDAAHSFESPIGVVTIYSQSEQVVHLEITETGRPAVGRSKVLATAEKQLKQYFSGKRTDFDVPIKMTGTAFQAAVWKMVSEIPFGEVLSGSNFDRLPSSARIKRHSHRLLGRGRNPDQEVAARSRKY
jgi:methylated-DNA-[protein]-cysteine S-methyltransferase